MRNYNREDERIMGKLIDKYLRELSQGENLKVSKVLQVAENLPDLSRDWFDKRVYLFYSNFL